MSIHYFTFGQSHMSSYTLPGCSGRLADYWVEVESDKGNHRTIFINEFTSRFCPNPIQFGTEYDEVTFKPEYFPGGRLCLIKSTGEII